MESGVTVDKQLQTLYLQGSALAEQFGTEQSERQQHYGTRTPKKNPDVLIVRLVGKDKKEEEPAPEPLPPEKTHFEERYQRWYSFALPLMQKLAPERFAEFQSYYQPHPKRRSLDGYNFVIQDWIRRQPPDRETDVAPWAATLRCFMNQLAILKSIKDRLEWDSLVTEDHAERGMHLDLLETARGLMDINERSAGALAGKVLELHLRKLAAAHKLRFRKDKPPTRELVDTLKTAKVLDVPAHAQATWLAEIDQRSRAKGESPTKLQIRDLIDGTRWLIANVF